MYRKPNEAMVRFAIEEGWNESDAERGYAIFDYDGTGLLQIKKIEECYYGEYDSNDIDDESCATNAEKSGYCKIIPINELPVNFNMKRFGWIDTEENRINIRNFWCRKA